MIKKFLIRLVWESVLELLIQRARVAMTINGSLSWNAIIAFLEMMKKGGPLL